VGAVQMQQVLFNLIHNLALATLRAIELYYLAMRVLVLAQNNAKHRTPALEHH
jgi:hypothetical protein